MRTNNRVTFYGLIIIFLLVCPRLNAGVPLGCKQFNLKGKHSRGIFGCYKHYANYIAGFVVSIEKVNDQKSCIVLTTDSTYYDYYDDSVRVKKRFSVSWEKDVFGKSYAKIILPPDAGIDITWRNDSLSIGHVPKRRLAEGENCGLYAKCCR